MKKMLLSLIAVVAGLVALILWMAGGLQSTATSEPEVIDLGLEADETKTSSVTVVSYNIAWGFGWGSEGSESHASRSRADIEEAIQKMGSVLRDLGADIVLLQEVDFGAGRSKMVDEGRLLAEATGLRYLAPAPSWHANYIPFPYWPPEAHFGRMSSGGAILSRFPISSCSVRLLDKPATNPFWYNLFYLFRFVQHCEIKAGDDTWDIFNIHLEAFDGTNRQEQARVVTDWIRSRTKADATLIIGGDLNTVPPEAGIRHGYEDEPETDHRADDTLAPFRALPGVREAVSREAYRANESAYFTFPAHEPNRQLDHLFLSDSLTVASASVARSAGELSDHLPLVLQVARPSADSD